MLILWNHFNADDKPSYIYLTTNTPTTVQLSTSDSLDPVIKSQIDQTITIDSEFKILLPPELQGTILQKETKAVRIRSTEPISVVLFDNNYESSDDSSMILPTSKLSTSYMVVSSVPLYTNFPVYSSVFGVAALDENTSVNITLQLSDKTSSVTIDGKVYGDSDTLELSMNSLETFQVGHGFDLSGTTVRSSKPVAVFSGNRCNMFSGSFTCSHMMEQLPPVKEWDKTFIVPPDFNSNGSLIRMMSDVDSNVIFSRNPSDQTSVLIQAGTFYDLNANSGETVSISSDSPLLVANFVKGTDTNANAGDPYMTIVQGLTQYRDQYRFVAPDEYLTNYVTITIPTSSASDLRVNGQPVDQTKIRFQSQINMSGSDYAVLTVEVPSGFTEVNTASLKPFGLVVNGYRSLDSHGFGGSAVFA